MTTKERHILPHLIPSTEFVEITGMDPTVFYMLWIDHLLPTVRVNKSLMIDMTDIRAKRHMPGFIEPVKKDLFAWPSLGGKENSESEDRPSQKTKSGRKLN